MIAPVIVMNRKMVAILEATAAVVVWGGSFVATKVVVREISPITLIWLRFGIGLVILWAAVAARKQVAFPNRKDLVYLAVVGFIGIPFHQWLQSTGLETSQASTTAWIVATIPVFMAVLGWLVLHENFGWKSFIGIAIAAAGVLLVVSEGNLAALARGRFGAPGDFLILISAPNWAVFSLLSRRGLKTYPAAQMMAYVMTFGWLFSSVMFFAGPGLGELKSISLAGWAAVGFLGVFCSGLAYIFWYDALQALPVAQVGAFVYLEPFVTVVVAAILLGEPLLAASVLGGVAILVGVWLVQLAA